MTSSMNFAAKADESSVAVCMNIDGVRAWHST